MSSSSASYHRQARKESGSSTENESLHQYDHQNADHNRSRNFAGPKKEESPQSCTQSTAGPHPQFSHSDHRSQQEESFVSNAASFGGSSHNTGYMSENNSHELEAQTHEPNSQYTYCHLDYFSHDRAMVSHYDNHLAIEEDPNEQYSPLQLESQLATTISTTENGIQAASDEIQKVQKYSPTTEMWALHESRDERIRLGLPGGQEFRPDIFGYDEERVTEAH
ncbi:uncharacterized protein EAE97_004806 [Botrytis byssoidea]|uniref:Uncharacterized protein n=1 Tax=Botrytis byssoidea TaxID=139641 RepID=A0A9P5INI1_9HELO|nr:uncharacterized protein EAE97_004806 [Botrytis byssoidea]KAF7945768.1 hypothetical protein EAE97_004806 [Botrytis byssoidea]